MTNRDVLTIQVTRSALESFLKLITPTEMEDGTLVSFGYKEYAGGIADITSTLNSPDGSGISCIGIITGDVRSAKS